MLLFLLDDVIKLDIEVVVNEAPLFCMVHTSERDNHALL